MVLFWMHTRTTYTGAATSLTSDPTSPGPPPGGHVIAVGVGIVDALLVIVLAVLVLLAGYVYTNRQLLSKSQAISYDYKEQSSLECPSRA